MKTLLIALLLLAVHGQAQDKTVGWQSSLGAVNADGQTGRILSKTSMTPPSEVVDTSSIGGSCVFQESWCPGAKAILKDAKGTVLQQTFLTRDGFKFGGLHDPKYTVVIEYPKYKLKAEMPDVPAGRIVTVSFDEKK